VRRIVLFARHLNDWLFEFGNNKFCVKFTTARSLPKFTLVVAGKKAPRSGRASYSTSLTMRNENWWKNSSCCCSNRSNAVFTFLLYSMNWKTQQISLRFYFTALLVGEKRDNISVSVFSCSFALFSFALCEDLWRKRQITCKHRRDHSLNFSWTAKLVLMFWIFVNTWVGRVLVFWCLTVERARVALDFQRLLSTTTHTEVAEIPFLCTEKGCWTIRDPRTLTELTLEDKWWGYAPFYPSWRTIDERTEFFVFFTQVQSILPADCSVNRLVQQMSMALPYIRSEAALIERSKIGAYEKDLLKRDKSIGVHSAPFHTHLDVHAGCTHACLINTGLLLPIWRRLWDSTLRFILNQLVLRGLWVKFTGVRMRRSTIYPCTPWTPNYSFVSTMSARTTWTMGGS